MKKIINIICIITVTTLLVACNQNENSDITTTEFTTLSQTTQSTTEATTQTESATVTDTTQSQEPIISEAPDKLYIINDKAFELPLTLNDMGDDYSFGLYPEFGENTIANELCYKGVVIATAISDKYAGVGDGDRNALIYNIYGYTDEVEINEIDDSEPIDKVIEFLGDPQSTNKNTYTFKVGKNTLIITVDDNNDVINWEI